MLFQDACGEAMKQSHKKGVAFYVHNAPTSWEVTPIYRSGWLFKVYPGGRRILSIEGKKVYDAECAGSHRRQGVL